MTRPPASATVVVFFETQEVTQPGISVLGSDAECRKMLPSLQVTRRSELVVSRRTP
jgi:hypothetical protein